MMTPYLHLNNISSFPKLNTLEMLQTNLEGFFNWGLIEAGYFSNIQNDILKPVVTPGVTVGRVWQGIKRQWVYESGLESSSQPVVASGVFINNSFYETSTTTGIYAHYIDYPNGKIVFNNAIDSSSTVSATYSYKNIGIYDEEVPWFRDLIFDSFGYDQPTTTMPSGVYALLDQYAVQLPAIVIESVGSRQLSGRELGNSSLWVDQDLLFHVITENSTDRNNIVDIITLQRDRSINLFNPNIVAQNNSYPLDYRGMINPSGLLYPQLVNPTGLAWFDTGYLVGMSVSDSKTNLPLYNSNVRVTIRV